MAAEFAARQQATQQVSEVNKRIARRAAYMDEVSQVSPLLRALRLQQRLPVRWAPCAARKGQRGGTRLPLLCPQRNDAPLAVGLVVAFLGPALVILAVAGGTGYLEKLYDASLTLR